jgi:hypothetical protein
MSTSDLVALVELTPLLTEIPLEEVVYPNMPVATFANECEELRETALKDTPFYINRRIDIAVMADTLDKAVGALRAAELKWSNDAVETKEAASRWKELQEEAYDLRDEALYCLDYILDENDHDSIRRLEEIEKGSGNTDMIMDLGKLGRFCREHDEQLDEEVGFSEQMIDRLDELYTILTDIYGKVSSDKKDRNEARILRDRAFTYCKQLERKIKKAAKLALRKHPELLERYRSEYQHKLNLRKRNSEDDL